MQKFSLMNGEQVLQSLKTSVDGLTTSEATARLKKFGQNKLKQGKKVGVISLFFSQFKDVMTVLLIVAGIISGVIAVCSGDANDFMDTVIILFIIVLNAVVGTVQQFKADKAIEKLKTLSVVMALVKRDGREVVLDSKFLTVGDVILLKEGDVVPADCRILSCNNLKCDESALTGESVSVEKSAGAITGEKNDGTPENMLFSSTFVVQGNAVAVVTAVGMNTEIGGIADMLADDKKSATPLEKALATLGKVISIFVLITAGVVFLLGVFLRGQSPVSSFMTSVALAVAAIPEGLPAVVTVIMALGVQKMTAKNTVIRKLKSIETLGSCNCICTDKTGTLTQNKMKVISVWTDGKILQKDDACTSELLLACMCVCNDVKGKRGAYMGDSTEIALKNYCDEQDFFITAQRLLEKPFNSVDKTMSVAVEYGGRKITFIKGAPDKLLNVCDKVRMGESESKLDESARQKIIGANDEMSDGALRVLGFAYAYSGDKLAQDNFTFLGLCGMMDQIKRGVKDAVATCDRAGISTVMITGDHVRTAFAIAKKVGITDDFDKVISGDQLDGLSKVERVKKIRSCRVFARVTPRHKNLIVKTLQKSGNVVAMTGDGINDAPSIKSADIGIAMGKTGAEVTKSVADMVVSDDNFTTIVSAVSEGRRISSNVRKAVQFFISTNVAEVLSLLFATIFFAGERFLLSTQLLWINLITDSFPVLALGVEKAGPENMISQPVRAEKAIFSRRSVAFMLFFGAYITAITVLTYTLSLHAYGSAVATTMTFLVISFAELFQAINVRTEFTSLKKCGLFSNGTLVLTLALAIIVNVLLCITPLGALLGVTALALGQWAWVFGLSFSVVVVGEIYKFVIRKIKKLG